VKIIGWSVSFIVVIFLSYIFSGYAFTVLWDWFIVPIFGISSLELTEAMGLVLIINYTTMRVDTNSEKKEPREAMINAIAIGITKPLLALLSGWVITLFM
jgi:hypothetical protein